MILLVTPSARIQECADAIHAATGKPTDLAATLQAAVGHLRAGEYAAVVIDQFLLEADPDEAEQMLGHLGTAVPVHVNCAISGVERVVREVRAALGRRQLEERVARRSAEQAVWNELKESITTVLLSCDLALTAPGMPDQAAEKIRTIHEAAQQIRLRLEKSEQGIPVGAH